MNRPSFLSILSLLCLFLPVAQALAQPTTVSYQGQLDLNGSPFNNSADFKFVILCGAASAWSNDGSSTSGSEPAAAITLAVTQGLFSLHLGDAALSMVPLSADLLEGCVNPRLRVWVDTGSGFEQLSDQALASSPFALQSDVAARSLGDFNVVQGDLAVLHNSTKTITLDGSLGQVGVNSIRFADNSVLSTANGIGAPDGDWTIAGNDMFSGVSGNVGIGTSTPDRKLALQGGTDILSNLSGGFARIGLPNDFNLLFDARRVQGAKTGSPSTLFLNPFGGNVGVNVATVSAAFHVGGDTRVDGTNGNGIDSRNPNATTAILRLGWLNNIARIRVGGSGLGSTSGLDIQGTSDISLLRILDNGNIGLGTTTPTVRLDVNGNAHISGNLVVDGALTGGGVPSGSGILSLTANVMNATDDPMTFHRSSVLLNGTTAGQGLTFETTINLPDGVTITAYSAIFTDSDATRNIQTFLLRTPLAGGAGSIIATQASSGTPGRVTQTSTGLSEVVDNANNAYVVTANWTTPTTVLNVRLHGYKIVYSGN